MRSVVIGPDGLRSATATWHTHGHGVNFQPVSAFPEPGLMSWNDDGTVMIEHAPSGAYVEEWRLVAASRHPLGVTSIPGDIVYRAGDVAVLVRDRIIPVPRQARLVDLVDEHVNDRPMIEALLDCEFSVARRLGGEWTVVSSTLPWQEGKVVDVDLSSGSRNMRACPSKRVACFRRLRIRHPMCWRRSTAASSRPSGRVSVAQPISLHAAIT